MYGDEFKRIVLALWRAFEVLLKYIENQQTFIDLGVLEYVLEKIQNKCSYSIKTTAGVIKIGIIYKTTDFITNTAFVQRATAEKQTRPIG